MDKVTRRLFDKTIALQSVDGDIELLKEIADVFNREYRNDLDVLANAIECGNSALVENTSHALRNSVIYFGADSATDAALRLEILGRTGNFNDARHLFTEFAKILTAVSGELAKL